MSLLHFSIEPLLMRLHATLGPRRFRWRSLVLVAGLLIGGLHAVDSPAAESALETLFETGQYELFLKQAVPAAQAGDADAQFLLGKAYQLGRGVPADGDEAIVNYRLAAEQNHARALNNLGQLTLEGDSAHRRYPDASSAEEYLLRALALGLKLPTLYNLGVASQARGHFEKAGDYYAQAYDAGFGDVALSAAVRAYAMANNSFPTLDVSAAQRPALHAKALRLVQIANDKGLGSPMQNMAAIYMHEKQYDQALLWARRAADKGVPPALHTLGLMADKGLGMNRDPELAQQWYLRAAEAGYGPSVKSVSARLWAKMNAADSEPELRGVQAALVKIAPDLKASSDQFIDRRVALIERLGQNAAEYPSMALDTVDIAVSLDELMIGGANENWGIFGVNSLEQYKDLDSIAGDERVKSLAAGISDDQGRIVIDPAQMPAVLAAVRRGRSLVLRAINTHALLEAVKAADGRVQWLVDERTLERLH